MKLGEFVTQVSLSAAIFALYWFTMKARFVSLAITFIVSISGMAGISNAQDVFSSYTFSGQLTLNSPLPQNYINYFGNTTTLNYAGALTFDQTQVNALKLKDHNFGVYPTFIADGGSLSLTLNTSLGNFTFNTNHTAPGSSAPTLVISGKQSPVGFNFDLVNNTVIPLELALNTPLPNPIQPSNGLKSYTGLQENVTFSSSGHNPFSVIW
jgi:hypothetical protein